MDLGGNRFLIKIRVIKHSCIIPPAVHVYRSINQKLIILAWSDIPGFFPPLTIHWDLRYKLEAIACSVVLQPEMFLYCLSLMLPNFPFPISS